MSAQQKKQISPFEVISRSEKHRGRTRDVLLEWHDLHTGEWEAPTPKAFDRVRDSLAYPRETSLAYPYESVPGLTFVTQSAAQYYVPAYIASLLTMFAQAPVLESPKVAALENRVGRLEKALRRAGILYALDERADIDWRDPQVVIEKTGLSELLTTCTRILREVFGDNARVTSAIEKDPTSGSPALVLRLGVPRSLRDRRDAFLTSYGRETVIPAGAPVPVLLWEYHDAVPA